MGHPQVPESPRVAEAAQPAEDYDVSQRQDVAKLRKHAIGLGGVLFLTVTGSAPISAMLFNVPIIVGNDPNSQAYLQLYGLMAVMGVIIILSVQAVVSLSVLVYYERFHRDEAHWWKTRLAPLLSFFSQAFVVYLLFTNITFLGARL